MKIDLSTPLRTPKGEPYTHVQMAGASVYHFLRRLHGEGVSFADALKKVEETAGGKDLLRPMDVGDAFYNAIEVCKEYNSGAASEKRVRGKLLDKLIARGEVDLSEDEITLLRSAIEDPGTFNGSMLVAIERVITAAEAKEAEELQRKRDATADGAKLVAVENEAG